MTRKDYEAIAAAFYSVLAIPNTQPFTYMQMVIAFADVAAMDNARFDRAKFYSACGMTASEPV
jgi:hypothetical protein